MTRYTPYKEGDKWFLDVDANDEVYYVANVNQWLLDNNTTASDFTPVTSGCTVLLKGLPQGDNGGLLPVKLKVDFGVAEAYCTFRVDTEDGQQFDKTMWFKEVTN